MDLILFFCTMTRMGTVDDLSLICLCQFWAEYIKAAEQARKTGMLVKSPSGYAHQWRCITGAPEISI